MYRSTWHVPRWRWWWCWYFLTSNGATQNHKKLIFGTINQSINSLTADRIGAVPPPPTPPTLYILPLQVVWRSSGNRRAFVAVTVSFHCLTLWCITQASSMWYSDWKRQTRDIVSQNALWWTLLPLLFLPFIHWINNHSSSSISILFNSACSIIRDNNSYHMIWSSRSCKSRNTLANIAHWWQLCKWKCE